MKCLTPKQRRKLAMWIGYPEVKDFKPDTNPEHSIILVQYMSNAPQTEAMMQEMQLALCVAALGYVSHYATADAALATVLPE